MKEYNKFAGYGQVRTAKNYGLEGLGARGFKAESLLKPGVNEDELQATLMSSYPTGRLLYFQLRRKFLAILHFAVSWYKWLPILVKQVFAVRMGCTTIEQFNDAITSSWKWSTPDVVQVAIKLEQTPVHLSVILRYNQRIYRPQDDSAKSDASVGAIQKLFRLQEKELKEQQAHDLRESDSLIDQIVNLIYWSIVSNIPVLTLYEQTGFVADLDFGRVISLIRDKLALTRGIPNTEIRVHIRSSRTKHRFCHNDASTTESVAYQGVIVSDNDNCTDADEQISPGLDVIVLRQADVAAAFEEAADPIFSALQSRPVVDAIPELISEMISKGIYGMFVQPDMLILLGSQAKLDGFPSYEMRNAFVYRDFTHRPAVDAKLFCRALRAFSNH